MRADRPPARVWPLLASLGLVRSTERPVPGDRVLTTQAALVLASVACIAFVWLPLCWAVFR